MSRKRSGASDKSDSSQASPVLAQTSVASLTGCTGTNLVSMDKSSIEPSLATDLDGASSFPGSDAFGPFSDDLSPWYNFGDFAASSPFTQQPSPTAAFFNEEPRSYSSVDSAYVSPASLFTNQGDVASLLKPSGLFSGMNRETNRTQNVTAAPSSSHLALAAICSCVRNHADLLYCLKELEQRHGQPRLDVVLSSAQQALVPWRSIVECRVCRHDGNQEVLFLSAMSIGTVLQSLQSLCSEYYTDVISGQDNYDQQGATIDVPGGMQSAIGIYEITGEERMAVKDLLISRILDKMKYTLAGFKERLESLDTKKDKATALSPRKRMISDQSNSDVERLHQGGPGDLDHLVKVWRNLDSTVQTLERVLKSGNILHAKADAAPKKRLVC